MDTSNKSNQKSSSKAAKAGLFVAFTASLCCITPVLAFISGVSGVAATFSWLEPLRPFMIALTIGVLGFAWFQKLIPNKAEEIACDCEEDGKEPFFQSKMFLGIVTVLAALMLSFPNYSHVFYPDIKISIAGSTQETVKYEIKISGMTCTGCEEHVKHEIAKLPGISELDVSYNKGNAIVSFDNSMTSIDSVENAINLTGYIVQSQIKIN